LSTSKHLPSRLRGGRIRLSVIASACEAIQPFPKLGLATALWREPVNQGAQLSSRVPMRARLFRSIVRIKINNKRCLPENVGQLFCARGRTSRGATRFEGEGLIMADNNSNGRRDEEAEKLRTYQRDRDMLRRGVKIDDAIHGITDDDRKTIINKSLRRVHSALSVG
jgi:hypothetical protein